MFPPPRFALPSLAAFAEDRSVRHDAETLLRGHGGAALETAERNAGLEDLGLLRTARAGHWSRVAREIERRAEHARPPARPLAA